MTLGPWERTSRPTTDGTTRRGDAPGRQAPSLKDRSEKPSYVALKSYNQSVALVDTVPPVASISSPVHGSVLVSKKTNVVAQATDHQGAVTIELSIDSRLRATSTTGAISYEWTLGKLAKGNHTIVARATDADDRGHARLLAAMTG